MTTSEFKKIGQKLKKLYAQLEIEAQKEGITVLSPAWDLIIEKAREALLKKEGFTIEEYREAKDKIEAERLAKQEEDEIEHNAILEKIALIEGKQGPQGESGHTPTDSELIALIRPLIPAPIPGKTPTIYELIALIREVMPKVKDGETPSDERLTELIQKLMPSFDTNLGYLEDKIETVRKEIPIPEKIDLDKLKSDILEDVDNKFSENFKKNIDIMGMPDFRKLAMGLQEEISRAGHTIQDEGTSVANRKNLNFVGTGVTATDSASTNTTTITIGAGGHTIQNASSDLTQRTNLNFFGSLIATDDSGNNQTDVDITANFKKNSITVTLDGQGGVISTGLKGFTEVPYACTITGWTLLADVSGSIVIDVWADSYANFPPVVGKYCRNRETYIKFCSKKPRFNFDYMDNSGNGE